jgi:hypothetical protein
MKQFKINYITGRRKQTGATLLVIIIAMIVLAVLAVAMYTLTSTATLNQVIAQRAARAFYLSESGIRIAASEYKAAAPTAKNSTLVSLQGSADGRTFTMPDSSTVKIKVYPYWFYATIATGATSSLTLYLPGIVPRVDDSDTPITFPATGLLKIKDQSRSLAWEGSTSTTTFANYNNVTVGTFDAVSGTPVTFTLSASFPAAPNQIIIGDEFYIGNTYTSPQQPDGPNQGGDLILNVVSGDPNDDSAKIFPPQKGTIFVVLPSKISLYSYDSRIITTTSSPHTVTLTNMQAIAEAPTPQWPLTVSPTVSSGKQIYVGKSLGFRSTSNYGQ